METTLLEKLKKYLAAGELDGDVKGDVVVEMLKIIANDYSCYIGLSADNKIDAAEYAFELFLVSWEKMVKETDNWNDLRRKLRLLCLNACQIQRRKRLRPVYDAPLGVRMGDDFPGTWEI